MPSEDIPRGPFHRRRQGESTLRSSILRIPSLPFFLVPENRNYDFGLVYAGEGEIGVLNTGEGMRGAGRLKVHAHEAVERGPERCVVSPAPRVRARSGNCVPASATCVVCGLATGESAATRVQARARYSCSYDTCSLVLPRARGEAKIVQEGNEGVATTPLQMRLFRSSQLLFASQRLWGGVARHAPYLQYEVVVMWW